MLSGDERLSYLQLDLRVGEEGDLAWVPVKSLPSKSAVTGPRARCRKRQETARFRLTTMETHYTHTTWHVKDGSEEEFVRRWGEWAEWSRRQGLVEDALLLQDTEDPRRFVSFGPWESVAAIAGWRALPGYQERVDRLRRVVDGFEPCTLEVVARR